MVGLIQLIKIQFISSCLYLQLSKTNNKQTKYGLLISCLMSNDEYFIHFQDVNNLFKSIQKCGSNSTTGTTTFDCLLQESMEGWTVRKHIQPFGEAAVQLRFTLQGTYYSQTRLALAMAYVQELRIIAYTVYVYIYIFNMTIPLQKTSTLQSIKACFVTVCSTRNLPLVPRITIESKHVYHSAPVELLGSCEALFNTRHQSLVPRLTIVSKHVYHQAPGVELISCVALFSIRNLSLVHRPTA